MRLLFTLAALSAISCRPSANVTDADVVCTGLFGDPDNNTGLTPD